MPQKYILYDLECEEEFENISASEVKIIKDFVHKKSNALYSVYYRHCVCVAT